MSLTGSAWTPPHNVAHIELLWPSNPTKILPHYWRSFVGKLNRQKIFHNHIESRIFQNKFMCTIESPTQFLVFWLDILTGAKKFLTRPQPSLQKIKFFDFSKWNPVQKLGKRYRLKQLKGVWWMLWTSSRVTKRMGFKEWAKNFIWKTL